MKIIHSGLTFLFIYGFIKFVIANDWLQVTEGQNGHIFYVDLNSTYEKKSHIYFWQLINYNEKDEYGDYSAKILIKGNCNLFKFKWLKISYHKEIMASKR